MNNLMIFEEREVEVFEFEGKVLFNPLDVAVCLDMAEKTVRNHMSEMDEDEVVKLTNNSVSLLTGFRKLNNAGENFLTKEGVLALVIKSRKPEAIKFQKWVTKEVLPSILDTGSYIVKNKQAEIGAVEKVLERADAEMLSLFQVSIAKQIALTKENERLALENKDLKEEVFHKEDVIVGLVDTIDLASKRQVLNRVVRYGGANFQQRWRELYKQFEMKFHIDLEKRLESYNANNKPKLSNKLDYIDKVMGKVPEIYEIACKIYEQDVKILVDQMYGL